MSSSFSCRHKHAVELAPFHAAFLSDDTLITIVPNFDLAKPMNLLSSTSPVGPFKAGLPTRVPLWLATLLHQRQLADITTPEWLEPEWLARVAQLERRQNPLCGETATATHTHDTPTLPFYYYQLAQQLLKTSSSSMDSAQRASSHLLVQDVAQLRLDKIRQQFQVLTAEETTNPSLLVAINGIASNEMLQLKPFITQALNDQRYLATGHNNNNNKSSSSNRSGKRQSQPSAEDASQAGPTVAPPTNALRSRLRRLQG